jgi:hypothetical protein
MKELAMQTVKRLFDAFYDPESVGLDRADYIGIIEKTIKKAYEDEECKGHEQELFEELSLLFEQLSVLYSEIQGEEPLPDPDPDPDKMQKELILSYLSITLGVKNLLDAPQKINAEWYIQTQVHALWQKYTGALYTEKKTILGFMEYLLKENSKIFPFFERPSFLRTLPLKKSVYQEAFLAEINSYTRPLNVIANVAWQGVRLVLGAISLATRPILFLVQQLIGVYRVVLGGALNLITGGIYQKMLLDYLKDSGIEYDLKGWKNISMGFFLEHIKDSSYQLNDRLRVLSALKEADHLQGFEFLDFMKEKLNYNPTNKKDLLFLMKMEVSGWANLNMVLTSCYKSITKPLSEIKGSGAKFLSVALIRPAQVISAFVILPLMTVLELAQLVKNAIQYTVAGLQTLICFAAAVLFSPIKLFDMLTKNIMGNTKSKNSKPKSKEEESLKDSEHNSKPPKPQANPEPQKEEAPPHHSSLFSSKKETPVSPTEKNTPSLGPKL